MDVSVYLFTGFLEAGKTKFINETLNDTNFNDGKRKFLIISCEEGEEEYDPRFLQNVTVVTVEDEEDLKCSWLKELEKQYKPTQVLIEYNGMWQMERLYREVLPANWVLYQIMTFIKADTFELYAKNMGQLMMEKVINADLLVFNRATQDVAAALRERNLRMVNRQADMYIEFEDGTNEDYINDDTPPFDMEQEVIDIPDEDYGVFFVDAMDHPDRYDGRLVKVKLVMCHSQKYPGIHCPGRFVMTCCENDITFYGLIAYGEGLEQFENRDWVEVTARMGVEEHVAYEGPGPVMHVISIAPAEKAAQEVVTF